MGTLESLVGVPYRLGGSDRSGADCWGLTRLGFWVRRGIELPPYNGPLAGQQRPPGGFVAARESAESARAWERVQARDARELDVVVISVRAPSDHVAVVTHDPRRLLTTSERTGAHLARWGRGSAWDGRIAGVWRYVGAGRAAAE